MKQNDSTHTIIVDGVSINYQIQKRTGRIGSIGMSFTRDGLLVRAPRYVPDFAVKAFVSANKEWIIREHRKFLEKKVVRKNYDEGEIFLYLGESYPLVITETEKVLSPRLRLTQKYFEALVPPFLSTEQLKIKLAPLFDKWYLVQAEKVIAEKVNYFARQLGVKYNSIRIKKVNSVWGSCSAQQNLSFNINLIRAPETIVDYVVIHEVVHLIHKHHQRDFWYTVLRFDSHYKAHVKWLKMHGHGLDV